MSDEMITLPIYQSHKKVWALEIKTADRLTCKVSFKDDRYADKILSSDMWSRYQPTEGDFYVEYEDGYKSFSPRKAFLEGYMKV